MGKYSIEVRICAVACLAIITSIFLWIVLASREANAANPSLPSDLNNDGIVDIFDLSILLSNYGKNSTIGDLSSPPDGKVDMFDLSTLLTNYGKTSGVTVSCAVSTPNVPDGPDPWGGCWPGPSNTGVPQGTILTNYAGPCTVTGANVTIDSKTVNCSELVIGMTTNLVIKNSVVNGIVYADEGNTGSLTIQDSEVNAGTTSFGAVSYDNITVIRSEIQGGQHNVQCTKNCRVVDSWLHDSIVFGESHNNAFISNGGSDYSVEHTSLHCNRQPIGTAGCSADLSLFGDFAPIERATVSRSLFVANSTGASYCLYGGTGDSKPYDAQANTIKMIDNVFQRGSNNKCGESGPVTGFLKPDGSYPTGNVWSGNVWSNGGAVLPSS